MDAEQLAALSEDANLARANFDFGLITAKEKSEALGKYAAALMELHRTGKLVLIDDGAVERVAEALCRDAGCVWDFDPETDNRKEWRSAARAALSALGVT